MAKNKDFSKSLGSKRLNTLIPTDDELSQKEGKKNEESKSATTVTTFRVENENLLAIKAIAFWDRKKIQDVFNEALADYIQNTPKATLKKAVEEYKKRNNI